MSGWTSISIIPLTSYDLASLRDGVVTIPIAQRIDVSGADRLALEVRVFSGHFPAKSELTIQVASDGFTPDAPGVEFLQTRTSTGKEIAALRLDSATPFPSFMTLDAPVAHVGRLMAVILAVRGGPEGGPRLTVSIDGILHGVWDVEVSRAGSASQSLVEPIVVRPEHDGAPQPAVQRRVTEAVTEAMEARAPRRYPRWREIVV